MNKEMQGTYVRSILNSKVYEAAVETPLDKARQLSARLKNSVYLKREDLQPVFSFKIRGAYNMMAALNEEQRARGVVTASAGNHAQGVALSAAKLGIHALIVMPVTTPAIKVDAVRARGAEVILLGDSFGEANAFALNEAKQTGRTYVHPYDNPQVIAGQGTIGVELLKQCSDLDAVFVPVGGGGLIAGIAAYCKYLRPDTLIIGVEAESSACLQAAMNAGRPVDLASAGGFADGVAVARIGDEPFALCRHFVDDVVVVSDDAICAAVKDIYDDVRAIAEPAGALALAGLKRYIAQHQVQGKNFAAVLSGANVNFDRLRYIAERAEIGKEREAILAVSIPEVPGSFRTFCEILGRRHITEFNYRYADPGEAHVFVGVELARPGDRFELITHLEKAEYRVIDLTRDEVAKTHLRHMVGGHSPNALNEQLYHFEFPERPGALLDFLSGMRAGWNISLFHYRNHGAAYGQVLMALQIPSEEEKDVAPFLDSLGYAYYKLGDSPGYRFFLG